MTQMTQINIDRGDPQTYVVIGAALAVHGELGGGFLEAVYCEALAIELEDRTIPFRREAPLKISYKNQVLSAAYRADFLCFEDVLVEVKALARLSSIEEAQIINYLKASHIERGLLLNFGASRLECRRFLFSSTHLCSSVSSVDNTFCG
ncbi:MAG: GxxExxY protein [Caulobacteraceae bacterium]